MGHQKGQARTQRFMTRRLALIFGAAATLLLGTALSGNTSPACTPIIPEPICEMDSDCGGPAPLDCDGSWACLDGACEFICDTQPPERCQSDADCAVGEACRLDNTENCCMPGQLCLDIYPACEGVCEPIQEPGCSSDADCAADEVCVMDWDECPPPPGCEPGMECPAVCGDPVPRGGHCEPAPEPVCYSSQDCGPGETCVIDPDLCPPDELCDNGEPCRDMFMMCGGHCEPASPPDECRDDADCAAGEQCQVVCSAEACDSTRPCPDPVCFGQCVPVEPPPFECWSDADCGPGEMCQIDPDDCWGPNDPAAGDEGGSDEPGRMACGGVCVPAPEPECFSNDDCGSGEICVIDPDLCPPDDLCDDGEPCRDTYMICVGHCEPASPPDECRDNADCAAGEQCQIVCSAEACDPTMPCPDPVCFGQCVPVEPPPIECWSDADCGPAEMCQFDSDNCWAPYDEDGDGQMDPMPCGGVCVPRQEPGCFSDDDCAAGFHCEAAFDGCCPPGAYCSPEMPPCDGICVPDATPECWSDADCGPQEMCDFDAIACVDPLPGSDDGGYAEVPVMPCPGLCVPRPEPGCNADWDCAADERCEMNWDRCDSEGWCSGSCVPIKECLSDADCPGGTFCDAGVYGCPDQPTCEEGLPCDPPQCVGVCVEGPFPFDA